jgi:hypothetical protein
VEGDIRKDGGWLTATIFFEPGLGWEKMVRRAHPTGLVAITPLAQMDRLESLSHQKSPLTPLWQGGGEGQGVAIKGGHTGPPLRF